MPGLLDFLNTPEAQMGIGLLAAGGPTTDPNQSGFGQRLAGAMAQQQERQKAMLQQKYIQSQIDENNSQNQIRQATLANQAKQDAYYMGGGIGGNVHGAGAGFIPQSAGSPSGAPGGMAAPGGKFAEWSQQYGIPIDALINDRLNNGGKGIAEMLMKRGAPDMQVSNGYIFDKNKQGAGFLPQLNTSQDGKSSMIRIGADGLPVVSAPQGAVDTFAAYQGAQANYKPIKVYNPQTGRDEYTTEGAVVAPMAGGRGNVQSSGYAGGDRNAANAESIRIIESELAKPDNSPADAAALRREVSRLKLQSGMTNAQLGQASNYAAGPSANEAASAAGRQATANSIGGQAGALLKESSEAANSATQSVASAQRMQQALDSDKVLSGPGASLRLRGMQIASTLGIPGKDDAEKIANTRSAIQDMAKLTLEGRKQMSGQGAITNQESALAERATSGSIDDLTAPEIRQLAQAAERSGRWKYAQHEAKMQAMSSDPAMAGNVALYKAAPMPDAAQKPPTPVATMRFNPGTGKLEKVQ
ncbi:hypothetical protein VLK31_34965 [Variovorax sp. H27-G14]|uniref:hypothetical protein n=1 Tax=Variovorax sp. H27-G14 TaxID=3111914 RepID=UPI0038FCB9A2